MKWRICRDVYGADGIATDSLNEDSGGESSNEDIDQQNHVQLNRALTGKDRIRGQSLSISHVEQGHLQQQNIRTSSLAQHHLLQEESSKAIRLHIIAFSFMKQCSEI